MIPSKFTIHGHEIKVIQREIDNKEDNRYGYYDNTREEIVIFTDKSFHPSVSSALSAFVKKMQLQEVRTNDMKIEEAIERFNKIEKVIIKSGNGKEM